MIIVMNGAATEGQVADVVERLALAGARVQRLDGEQVTLAASGADDAGAETDGLETMPGVAAVLEKADRTPGVDRASPGGNGAFPGHHTPPVADRGFRIGHHTIGQGRLFMIAGPCSVEDPATMDEIAAGVAAAGAAALRAGAYKPRSSPYSFQGLGEDGLAVARAAADRHALLLVSEVLDATQIPVAARYVHILQVGARNMYNTPLLRELGRAPRPVLLKRALSATIDEWLAAAEYIVSAGNPRVILCERGIRTFETATRNTLDLNAVPVVRQRTRLPILVDPSHGTGHRDYVPAMARAAIACGADGLMIEAHTRPDSATSDAAQTVDLHTLHTILRDARVGRQVPDRGLGRERSVD